MQSCLTSALVALPEPLASAYSLEDLLGDGAYALVYRVRSRETGSQYALKVVDRAPLAARALLPQLQREISHLRAHEETEHVVRLLEVTEAAGCFFLRFDLCERNLEQLIEEDGALEEDDCFAWLHEACLGVRALHDGGLVHRDLKPSNMLVDAHGSLRICDFGWACLERERLTGLCGTPQYAPPEMRQSSGPPHTTKADIYSLGACLQHFLLGRMPEHSLEFPGSASSTARRLRADAMQSDPVERPTAEELLQRHELLSESEGPLSELWRQGQALMRRLGRGASVDSTPSREDGHSEVPPALSTVPPSTCAASGVASASLSQGIQLPPPLPLFSLGGGGSTPWLRGPPTPQRLSMRLGDCASAMAYTPMFNSRGFAVGHQLCRH